MPMTMQSRIPGEERKRAPSKHSVTLDKRENVSVSGVTDVISFDEESVIAETELGVIIIRGVNLHVGKINLDSGELLISGEVDAIQYENPGAPKKSFIGRLFK